MTAINSKPANPNLKGDIFPRMKWFEPRESPDISQFWAHFFIKASG